MDRPGAKSTRRLVDCLIVGGGITGAGIAWHGARRGLRVALVDSNDFASGTSHLTSKLIHGGLRYLPQGRLRLVMESVRERSRLLNEIAPHLVTPLRFVVPYPWKKLIHWLVTALGIHVYGFSEWRRNGRGCPPLFGWSLRRRYPFLRPHPLAVSYWDAQANDARLVMSVLRSAQMHGAALFNYTRIVEAKPIGDGWRFHLLAHTGRSLEVEARCLINATGPWCPEVAESLGLPPRPLLWIKGTHILLRRPPQFGNDAIVIRSIRDGRLLWVIPWEGRLIVGTTESRYSGDLRNVRARPDEVSDLYESFVRYFPGLGVRRCDLVGAYAGVRPIVPQHGNSENRLSRRHEIIVNCDRRVVSAYGGKLTTFRKIAEDACDAADDLLQRPRLRAAQRRALRHEVLWPGLPPGERERLTHQGCFESPEVSREVVFHLVRLYGSDGCKIAKELARDSAYRRPIAPDLPYTCAELRYLTKNEWVVHLLDLVKRRTPLYFQTLVTEEDARSWAKEVAPILSWDSQRVDKEVEMVLTEQEADNRAIESLPASMPAEEALLDVYMADKLSMSAPNPEHAHMG